MSFPEAVDEVLDVSEDEGTGWDPYHVRSRAGWMKGDTRGSEHSLREPLATTPKSCRSSELQLDRTTSNDAVHYRKELLA